jgi:hypothetical protein
MPRQGHTVESLGFSFKFRCPWGGDSLITIIAHVAAEYKARLLSRKQFSYVYRCHTLALLRAQRAHKARIRPQVKLATDPNLDLADIPASTGCSLVMGRTIFVLAPLGSHGSTHPLSLVFPSWPCASTLPYCQRTDFRHDACSRRRKTPD